MWWKRRGTFSFLLIDWNLVLWSMRVKVSSCWPMVKQLRNVLIFNRLEFLSTVKNCDCYLRSTITLLPLRCLNARFTNQSKWPILTALVNKFVSNSIENFLKIDYFLYFAINFRNFSRREPIGFPEIRTRYILMHQNLSTVLKVCVFLQHKK